SDATTYIAPIAARAGGAFESMVWYQGHTEATFAVPPGGYAQALTQLFAYFATLNSRSFTKYVGTIPNIASASWGTPWTRHSIRLGAEKYCTASGAIHVAANDIDQFTDGIHESQAGAL